MTYTDARWKVSTGYIIPCISNPTGERSNIRDNGSDIVTTGKHFLPFTFEPPLDNAD